jgi:tetratricopeptide (TPR) repeat protein
MVPSALKSPRLLSGLLLFLAVSAVYLYAFPAPNIPYAAAVLLHVGVGVAATVLLIPALIRVFREGDAFSKAVWVVAFAGALLGCLLIATGTAHAEYKWLYAHIFVSALGVVLMITLRLRGTNGAATFAKAAIIVVVVAGVSYAAWYQRNQRWNTANRIGNPAIAPESMNDEGDGPQGLFFPSSAQTRHRGHIPSDYFTESQACQRCHQDIYQQWQSSMHHFSSFNNQWYRKSIEYMQQVRGVQPSKWCSGCHDPALLYSGKFDTPVKDQDLKSPEAQAGLGCMMCHSIVQVKSTMGQGDFFLEYPKLHELAASKNPVIRFVHDWMTKINPEPHRRVFLKPFMANQTADFCSSCHKVHLDVPVNNYRWVRGFNEYDNWQASGVSGLGARSFYYPPKPQQCADCHMPLLRSADMGNINGLIHSHQFAAANTAVPFANEDKQQLEAAQKFLKDSVTVDIFALSPEVGGTGGDYGQNEMSTTFAVGEEAESSAPTAGGGTAGAVTAPLNRVNATVRRGDDVRVDVVVRTRKVGHFFPGGTVDAYDTWVELKAVDDKGQTLFWSGKVDDDGRGPVEKGAHFYRSLQIDEHGHPITKRNAWAMRAVVYVRLIPPGAADTVHYRLHIPESAGNKITLTSRLLYRKFSFANTEFAYAGVYDPSQHDKYDAAYDDRIQTLTTNFGDVSGKIHAMPDIPITTVSSNSVAINVAPKGSKAPEPQVVLNKDDWTRWNDYGIGLLLQGDLKAAAQAFRKITEIDPNNVDGWVNLGRVAVQEGDMDRARVVLEKALALQPKLARANYFYAKVLRNDGKYDEAGAHLKLVLEQYPRDRVVRNELGRVYFLERKYNDAVREFQQTLEIDPEDLQANYNLMLCYQGLGDEQKAELHRKLYMRFKADEASQVLTGAYRQAHPEDNNERQAIHEHVSVPLAELQNSRGPSAPSGSQPKAQASGALREVSGK